MPIARPSEMSMPESNRRIDLRKVVAILKDESSGLAWDEAWDSFRYLDATYDSDIPFLKSLLKDEAAYSRKGSATHFAVKSLFKIGVPLDEIREELITLCYRACDDLLLYEVALQLGKASASDEQAQAALSYLIKKNRPAKISTKVAAFVSLSKVSGGFMKGVLCLFQRNKLSAKSRQGSKTEKGG